MKNIFLFVLLAIIFASCQNGHKHEEAITETDAHNHEGTKNQFTAYTYDFELFAEADPFAVGQSSNILSFFTNLPDFTALENASITIRLVVKGKEINQTLDEATKKGIYSFNITPETVGKGKLIYDIKTDEGEYQLIVGDISVFADVHDAIHYALETELPTINTTFFTKEQSWKIDFATELPSEEAFGQIIKTTAQVQSAQGDEVLVSAKTNGILMLSDKNIVEGKSVSEGEVLFSISGKGLADNNSSIRFAEAKNNFEKAKSDYERIKELTMDKIVSEKELQNSKNQYDNTKAVYDNLNQNFNSSGQSIVSPMSGFIKQLHVQNGQYIEAGQAIVSISQNKNLLLIADVQQKYSSILGTIISANIRSVQDNKAYSLEQLNGKVISYGRNTNNDNYLIPVTLQIDNNGSFVPGTYVELYLKSLSSNQALTIPNSAILEEQGNYSVFVQITPELFEKRAVKLGAGDGLKTEILKGISRAERVVTKGAILLKLSQASGELDAHSGHVH